MLFRIVSSLVQLISPPPPPSSSSADGASTNKKDEDHVNDAKEFLPRSSAAPKEIAPIPNPPAGPGHGPIKIICGGLMRMGSLSLANAFATLGFRAHHLLEDSWDVWDDVYRAAQAAYPRPGEKAVPFTRQDWDRILGEYDAVGDLAGYFMPQLVEAYPDAKVVLVQREFDQWWPSYESEVAAGGFSNSPVATVIIELIFSALGGVKAGPAMKRLITGWFRADTLEGIRANARARYEEHYAWIRKNVPRERLLEYRLGDGWEPLCEFLEVEVPPKEVAFPRVNDKVDHRARQQIHLTSLLPRIRRRLMKTGIVLIGILVVAVPLLRASRQSPDGMV